MKERIVKIVSIALMMVIMLMLVPGCKEGICKEEHDKVVDEQDVSKDEVAKTEDEPAGDQAFFVKIFLLLRSKSWCLKRADKDDYY